MSYCFLIQPFNIFVIDVGKDRGPKSICVVIFSSFNHNIEYVHDIIHNNRYL